MARPADWAARVTEALPNFPIPILRDKAWATES